MCVLTAAPSLAAADDTHKTAGSLLTDCGAEHPADGVEAFWKGHCLGMIEGMSVALNATSSGVCLPDGVETGQLERVVIKWLQDHPERLHKSRLIEVRSALTAAFPCKHKH